MDRRRALYLVAVPFAAIPILLVWIGLLCLVGIDWVREKLGGLP